MRYFWQRLTEIHRNWPSTIACLCYGSPQWWTCFLEIVEMEFKQGGEPCEWMFGNGEILLDSRKRKFTLQYPLGSYSAEYQNRGDDVYLICKMIGQEGFALQSTIEPDTSESITSSWKYGAQASCLSFKVTGVASLGPYNESQVDVQTIHEELAISSAGLRVLPPSSCVTPPYTSSLRLQMNSWCPRLMPVLAQFYCRFFSRPARGLLGTHINIPAVALHMTLTGEHTPWQDILVPSPLPHRVSLPVREFQWFVWWTWRGAYGGWRLVNLLLRL